MGKAFDLTGIRFGMLIVIRRVENGPNRTTRWLCKCDCGNEKVVARRELMNGDTRSCGCYRKQSNRDRFKRPGGKLDYPRLYRAWHNMRMRCYYPNCEGYKWYGGRGITVCKEWNEDFGPFRDWALSHGYTDELTLDRIDNDGNYEPSNCRWVSMKEQCANRRERGTSGVT